MSRSLSPDSGEPVDADDPQHWSLKMKELCEAVSMTRQNVHFYIKEGLVPPGRKRGRNMAFYGETHRRRLLLIRKLQEERFMPLAAIRALLEGRDHHFSPSQHDWLSDIREDLPETLRLPADESAVVHDPELAQRFDISRQDLRDFHATGIIAVRTTKSGEMAVAAGDLWLLELWSEAKAAGLVELGLTIENLRIYHDAISQLFEHETALFARLMSGLSANEAAQKLSTSLALGNRLMADLHRSKLQQFLSLSSKDS